MGGHEEEGRLWRTKQYKENTLFILVKKYSTHNDGFQNSSNISRYTVQRTIINVKDFSNYTKFSSKMDF